MERGHAKTDSKFPAAAAGIDLSHLAQRIGVRVAEAAQEVWVLFLVPILAIFFLRDGGNFHEVAGCAGAVAHAA